MNFKTTLQQQNFDTAKFNLLDNLTEIIFSVDDAGKILNSNAYTQQKLFVSKKTHSLFELYPQLTLNRWRVAKKAAIEKGHWIIQIRQFQESNKRDYVELRISHHLSDNNDVYHIFSREITNLGDSELLLNLIAQASAELTGINFFRLLVEQMAKAMHVKKVFITECVEQPTTSVRMLASWDGNDFSEDLVYDLVGTPCEIVINGRKNFLVEEKLSELYPIEKGFCESYFGVPIFDSKNESVIGHIAFFDNELVSIDGLDCTIFEILSSRASLELQKLQSLRLLNESEQNYKLIVENQTDLILRLKDTAEIIFASPSCSIPFGKDSKFITSSEFYKYIYPDDLLYVKEAFNKSLINPYESTCDCRVLKANDDHWYNWKFSSIVVENKIKEVIAVGRDISELMKMEDHARETTAKLAHVGRVRSMGELATGISHELNQPLTAILSFSQATQRLLSTGNADVDECISVLGRIATNAELAGDIIKRVRGFVKSSLPSNSKLDLNFLIDEIILLLSPKLRQNEITIIFEKNSELPYAVGETIQIQQVLLNLIVNAIESMTDVIKTKKKITIVTKTNVDGKILIEISDTGQGVPRKFHDKIFDAFVTTKSEGLGVGLSICHSIITAHGGEISFVTKIGKGTTFRFTLNLAEDSGRL